MIDNEVGLVRQQSFDCDGPVDIDIELGCGVIEVRLADDDATGTADTPGAADTPDAADTPGAADLPGTGGTAAAADFDAADTDATDTADPAGDWTDTDHPADRADNWADTGHPTDMADDWADTEQPPSMADADDWAGTGQPADRAGANGTAHGGTAGGLGRAVLVEVRHEPAAGAGFGLAGLVNWVSGQFGAQITDVAEQAVRETTIAMHGNRLIVRGPRQMPMRTVPLSVVVHTPAGSSVNVRSGSADVRLSGSAGRVQVDTGSGDISVDRAAGPVRVKTGSGSARLGPMPDGLSARSGSGDLEVSSLTGSGSLQTGSGDIWLGTVLGDKVTVRTGSGDLTVADAAEGMLQLVTGSGDLRVGIRSGVLAEMDVVSGSGRTRSDLPVSDSPPSDAEAALCVRARTGSGEAVVSAATA
jgi:hypothetical protein